jgi:hypothetical protein
MQYIQCCESEGLARETTLQEGVGDDRGLGKVELLITISTTGHVLFELNLSTKSPMVGHELLAKY